MPTIALLDIGGEGRYSAARNLNPKAVITLGARKGLPIPRRIDGRAESIPLPDRSVAFIIMERTPLRQAAVREMMRVIQPHGTIVLRHNVSEHHNPHLLACRLIPVRPRVRQMMLGRQEVQESKFELGPFRYFSLGNYFSHWLRRFNNVATSS